MKEYKHVINRKYTDLMNEILELENNEYISRDRFKNCLKKLQEAASSKD
jgi:hypothetical protein